MSNRDSRVPRRDDLATVVDADLGVRPQHISLNDREAQLVVDTLEAPRADVVEQLRELRNRE